MRIAPKINSIRFSLAIVAAGLLLMGGGHARATLVQWELSGVTFSDGGKAGGTFTFDAYVGAGLFSNVDFVTATGSVGSGAIYTDVCVTNVPTWTSSAVLFVTSTASSQTGLPGLATFFAGPLTDRGGA